MEVKEYQYNCYIKLFKLLKPFLTDKSLVSKIDNLESNDNAQCIWSLISTALLMSEREYEDKKIYEYLNDDSYEMFRNILEKQPFSDVFNDIDNNCILDYDSSIICDISRFYMSDLVDEYFEDLPYDIQTESEIEELDRECRINYFYHGPNDLIIKDNELDFNTLFRMVRNCLAHSHYEVIDENYIRLYHYNRLTNQLDLNIVLSNVTVLTILNELNEIQYKRETSIVKSNSYGYMLNDFLYRKDENDILWDSFGYYEYLRADGIYGDYEFVEVNGKNKLKMELIILSLLNALILYGYNENDNINYLDDVDLSKINVDPKILNAYINDRNAYYDHTVDMKKKALDKLKDNINKCRKIYESRGNVDNEYFRNLPIKINELEEEYKLEFSKYEQYITEKNIIIDREVKNFILRHLRNSLAHGNIRFEDDIMHIEDYDGNIKTFDANISVIDLLNILLDKKLISKIFDVELESEKINKNLKR